MKKCLNCGNTVTPSKYNPGKKYCSKKCGRSHYYQEHIEKEKADCKKWYQMNRDSEIEKNAEYRKQNRELFDWYHNKDRFNGTRDIILNRDNKQCRACKSKDKLNVHHKDGNGYSRKAIEKNNDISNLITLCSSCHHRLHWWQRKNNQVLIKDEDIVRTLRKLREVSSKSSR